MWRTSHLHWTSQIAMDIPLSGTQVNNVAYKNRKHRYSKSIITVHDVVIVFVVVVARYSSSFNDSCILSPSLHFIGRETCVCSVSRGTGRRSFLQLCCQSLGLCSFSSSAVFSIFPPSALVPNLVSLAVLKVSEDPCLIPH